jgi:hypothetical protein
MFHSVKGKLTPSIFNINTVTKTLAFIEHYFSILYRTLPGAYVELSVKIYPRIKVDYFLTYLLL